MLDGGVGGEGGNQRTEPPPLVSFPPLLSLCAPRGAGRGHEAGWSREVLVIFYRNPFTAPPVTPSTPRVCLPYGGEGVSLCRGYKHTVSRHMYSTRENQQPSIEIISFHLIRRKKIELT